MAFPNKPGCPGNTVLTARQRIVLECIREAVATHGTPPSLREIAAKMGITSTKGVWDHLIALEKKGFIKRAGGLARAISVTEAGRLAA